MPRHRFVATIPVGVRRVDYQPGYEECEVPHARSQHIQMRVKGETVMMDLSLALQ